MHKILVVLIALVNGDALIYSVDNAPISSENGVTELAHN
jgi:hypothetical protein